MLSNLKYGWRCHEIFDNSATLLGPLVGTNLLYGKPTVVFSRLARPAGVQGSQDDRRFAPSISAFSNDFREKTTVLQSKYTAMIWLSTLLRMCFCYWAPPFLYGPLFLRGLQLWLTDPTQVVNVEKINLWTFTIPYMFICTAKMNNSCKSNCKKVTICYCYSLCYC